MSKNTANEFAKTRRMFSNFVGYRKPLTYDAWLNVPEDQKLAVLFVQFYEQITLAWFKLVSEHVTEEDGIEEVLQYLNKNVDKIKDDKKRFTPAYIYTVSYNCLYSLCKKPNHKKTMHDNELIVDFYKNDDDEDKCDLFSCEDEFDKIGLDQKKEMIWTLIESRGRDAAVVVAELIGDDMDWFSANATGKMKKFSKWDHNRISDKRRAEIIADLRLDLQWLRDQDELGVFDVG